jgi:hypothetical protein
MMETCFRPVAAFKKRFSDLVYEQNYEQGKQVCLGVVAFSASSSNSHYFAVCHPQPMNSCELPSNNIDKGYFTAI